VCWQDSTQALMTRHTEYGWGDALRQHTLPSKQVGTTYWNRDDSLMVVMPKPPCFSKGQIDEADKAAALCPIMPLLL